MLRLLLSASLILTASIARAEEPTAKPRLILDADTANEIDDLYAIARMMRQDRYEVVALNSTQWVHYLNDDWLEPGQTSVEASQKLNEDLLRLLGNQAIPHPLGSVEPVGKPWGGFEPKDSAAAQAIIQHARDTSDGEKLSVVCLGASTNLASAIGIAPEIAPKLRCYLLGFKYDVDHDIWNKSSFNVRRDLNAADLLLNTEDLELHIMPANVSEPLKFDRDETFARNEALGPLGEYLSERWRYHAAHHTTRTMWDLALVEAVLRPEFAKQRSVTTPLENTRRQVSLYTDIDEAAMQADYWQAVTP
ncbi:MAG: nucleoside hydrolase [Planctomycetota bacterium]